MASPSTSRMAWSYFILTDKTYALLCESTPFRMPPPLGSQPGDTYPLLRLLVLLRFLLYLCLSITDFVTNVNTKMTCVTKFRRFNNKTVLSKSTPCRISVTLLHSKRCETSVILTKHTVEECLFGKR